MAGSVSQQHSLKSMIKSFFIFIFIFIFIFDLRKGTCVRILHVLILEKEKIIKNCGNFLFILFIYIWREYFNLFQNFKNSKKNCYFIYLSNVGLFYLYLFTYGKYIFFHFYLFGKNLLL